jgi:hypothetical protein
MEGTIILASFFSDNKEYAEKLSFLLNTRGILPRGSRAELRTCDSREAQKTVHIYLVYKKIGKNSLVRIKSFVNGFLAGIFS